MLQDTGGYGPGGGSSGGSPRIGTILSVSSSDRLSELLADADPRTQFAHLSAMDYQSAISFLMGRARMQKRKDSERLAIIVIDIRAKYFPGLCHSACELHPHAYLAIHSENKLRNGLVDGFRAQANWYPSEGSYCTSVGELQDTPVDLHMVFMQALTSVSRSQGPWYPNLQA